MTDQNSFSFANLGNLTEPITKLIETVSAGAGVLYEPTRIVRKAKAESEAAIIKAKADIDIQGLQERAKARLEENEIRRQRNIESVIQKAIPQLPEHVTSEKVDEDWVTQFINYAQDLSNEELQLIWAKLLAGEVTQPGSYSLRTMNILRFLKPSDAKTFSILGNLSWNIKSSVGVTGIFLIREAYEALVDKKIFLIKTIELDSLGIIISDGKFSINKDKGDTLSYFDYKFLVKPKKDIDPIYIMLFTNVGKELLSLCNREFDQAYMNSIISGLKILGYSVKPDKSNPK